MLNDQVFYHGIIRKTIVAFGSLFSNIYIDRKEGSSVDGTTVQRLQIPIAYAPKEKWLVRVEQDPTLDKNVYTTLPRLSFEITGYSYDPMRKLGKMNKLTCHRDGYSGDMFSPVPYNINISLYVLTKTQEDAMQIIEQILPTFAPEYTLAINAVPDMNIVQDVPVALNSISVVDEYDGDFQTRRFVTHTLDFTLKVNLFGAVSDNKIITTTNANIGSPEATAFPWASYSAVGDTDTGNINESWTDTI